MKEKHSVDEYKMKKMIKKIDKYDLCDSISMTIKTVSKKN